MTRGCFYLSTCSIENRTLNTKIQLYHMFTLKISSEIFTGLSSVCEKYVKMEGLDFLMVT